MTTPNEDTFCATCARHLHALIPEHRDYAQARALDAEWVVENMRRGILARTYSTGDLAIRRTCRDLGLRCTYRAINAYLEQE